MLFTAPLSFIVLIMSAGSMCEGGRNSSAREINRRLKDNVFLPMLLYPTTMSTSIGTDVPSTSPEESTTTEFSTEPSTSASKLSSTTNTNTLPADTVGVRTTTEASQSTPSPRDGAIERLNCGGLIDADIPGTFSTPNYPGLTSSSQDCSWKLETDGFDRKIYIRCSVSLQEDKAYDSALFVSRDSTFLPANTVVYNRGQHLINEHSVAGVMGIYFSTSTAVGGVRCSYETQAADYTGSVDRDLRCGGHYSADRSGYFQTPNYPSDYNNNDHCLYTVDSSYGSFVMSCYIVTEGNGYDYLLLSKDGRFTPRHMVRYSGNVGYHNVTSVGRSITAIFKSDYSDRYMGVRCSWNGQNIIGQSYVEE